MSNEIQHFEDFIKHTALAFTIFFQWNKKYNKLVNDRIINEKKNINEILINYPTICFSNTRWQQFDKKLPTYLRTWLLLNCCFALKRLTLISFFGFFDVEGRNEPYTKYLYKQYKNLTTEQKTLFMLPIWDDTV